MGQSYSKTSSSTERLGNQPGDASTATVSTAADEVPLEDYETIPSFSDVDSVQEAIWKDIEYEKYDFPFENLVFEGGGTKGVAYCGALKILEKTGIRGKIKRFAGNSAGGLFAAFLALGYSSEEMKQIFLEELKPSLLLDRKWCSWLTVIPSLLNKFGLYPGETVLEFFGRKIAAKHGDKNLTFMQLYKETGNELCMTVTNLNLKATVYCHPKTTPDMPIRDAMRMSMSIPGLFQAIPYAFGNDAPTDTYVDGGVLCNYPIHVFDGWWLSMKPEDTFLGRVTSLKQLPTLFDKKTRFGTWNEKTLGFLLYADDEIEVMQDELRDRVARIQPPLPRPDTCRARQRHKEDQEKGVISEEYDRVVSSADRFLKVLHESDKNHDGTIDVKEFVDAMTKSDIFTTKDSKILFGRDISLGEEFEQLDTVQDGRITFQEIFQFIEKHGIGLTSRFIGFQRNSIDTLNEFLNSLLGTMQLNLTRLVTDARDLNRTVGIDTDYVGTNDYELQEADKLYVMKQGERSTIAFLKFFIMNKHPPLKPEFLQKQSDEKVPYILEDN